MTTIVVRGANGVVVWVRVVQTARKSSWVCTRDHFSLDAPATVAGAEAFLVALAQHSASLVGAISQVTELRI